MIEFNYLYLSIPIFYFLNLFFIKKKFLLNITGDKHQILTSKNRVPLSGGIFLFLSFLVYTNHINNLNLLLLIFFYLVGFFSDLKILKSPMQRLILQIIFTTIFIFYNQIFLENTRVLFLDNLLENNIINIFFVVFCITVIINGTNFIDGVNCNVIGYYIIVSLTVYKLGLIENPLSIIFFTILLFIFLMNFFSKLYLGDNGSYFIAFIYSIFLIEVYIDNQDISPFFIVLLLWYPAFENLFSLIRKINFNRSPFKPDQNHLHQLIYDFFKKNNVLNYNYINTFVGILIIFYNSIIFYLASLNVENTQFQIILIIINIIVYSFIYTRLFKSKYKLLKK